MVEFSSMHSMYWFSMDLWFIATNDRDDTVPSIWVFDFFTIPDVLKNSLDS